MSHAAKVLLFLLLTIFPTFLSAATNASKSIACMVVMEYTDTANINFVPCENGNDCKRIIDTLYEATPPEKLKRIDFTYVSLSKEKIQVTIASVDNPAINHRNKISCKKYMDSLLDFLSTTIVRAVKIHVLFNCPRAAA